MYVLRLARSWRRDLLCWCVFCFLATLFGACSEGEETASGEIGRDSQAVVTPAILEELRLWGQLQVGNAEPQTGELPTS